MKVSSWKSKKAVAISILILGVIWFFLSRIINNSIYLPTPEETFLSFLEIIREENFYLNLSYTVSRSLESFAIALFLAIVVGVLAGINSKIYNFLIPIMAILKSIPTMAFIIIALIWLDKDKAPILIGNIIAFPILYEGVINCILDMDPNISMLIKTYKIKKVYVVLEIYLPIIFFNIYKILTSTLSLVLKVIIAGEVYGQPKYGIGAALHLEKTYLNTGGIFAYIIIIAVVTLIFDIIGAIVKTFLFNWRIQG